MPMFYSKAKELKAQYQEQSAIAIQSVFRGHLGRRRMKEAREKYAERIRQESATVIQCGVRRMLAKSLLHDKLEEMQRKKLSASATIIQSQVTASLASIMHNQRSNFTLDVVSWPSCQGSAPLCKVR